MTSRRLNEDILSAYNEGARAPESLHEYIITISIIIIITIIIIISITIIIIIIIIITMIITSITIIRT